MNNNNQINKVTVAIFNEDYVVKGEEEPEYIQMLASYVDRRMRMIFQRNPNLSSTKVASVDRSQPGRRIEQAAGGL